MNLENEVEDASVKADRPKSKNKLPIILSVAALVVSVGAFMYVAGTASNVSSDSDELKAKIEEQNKTISELKTKVDDVELDKGFSVDAEVRKDGFQAVFFTDEEVYFGKLSDGKLPGQVKLENIYYLQTGKYSQSSGTTSSDASLAKLGAELHGPEDVMYITRDQIKFWENIKEDSQVTKAIREYERKP